MLKMQISKNDCVPIYSFLNPENDFLINLRFFILVSPSRSAWDRSKIRILFLPSLHLLLRLPSVCHPPPSLSSSSSSSSSSCSSFWAAALKGPMTYAFTHRGNFSFSFSETHILAKILVLRPKSQSPGPNFRLKAQIPASSLNSQPQIPLEGHIPASRVTSQPQSSNPSHEAQISAWKLKSQP